MPRRHLWIPDTQVKPHVPLDHFRWIGLYWLEMRPDVVIHAGDHADMHSLSHWDQGRKKGEGARYQDDIDAANYAWHLLNEPLQEHNARKRRWKEALYNPEKHITLGNHEHRITREVENNPKLERKLSTDDLNFREYGWTVHPFLKPVELDGVWYAHYFYNPTTGKPWGGMMETRIKNVGHSFTQGHQQEKRTGERYLGNGTVHRGLVCGSAYLHDEDYRGPQANNEWRGIFIKNEVRNGNYDLMEVSLDFLCRKYEGMSLAEFMRRGKFLTWPYCQSVAA